MEENLGLGVMIRMLSGDGGETERAVKHATGRKVTSAALEKHDGCAAFRVGLTFEDGSRVFIMDNGQSCCESRYMSTDDDLSSMAGETLVSIEERQMAGSDDDDSGGRHDERALIITTDRAAYTIVNHNEHNGYYGGFSLEASLSEAP